jgi:hypothetical protein
MKLFTTLLFCVPLLAQDAPKPAQAAAPAQAPAAAPAESPLPGEDWLTGSIELGYRWIPNISGSNATYRSVVNLGEGPKLFNADFTLIDPHKRFFDRADFQASSWGGDPYNTARVTVRKENVYRLLVDYKNIEYFNFLPSFANTGLTPGSVLDQNSFDTHLRTADVDLDVFPNQRISPYFAFSHNSQSGTGISTFTTGPQNEFPVASSYSNQSNNYRAGVNINLGRGHLTLEQGGSTFKDDQGESDATVNRGDTLAPYLGQQLVLNNLGVGYRVRGDSIYEKALLAANPTSWMTISGNFVFSQPKTNTTFTDNANGQLYQTVLARFYTSGQDLLTSDAQMPHTSAGVNVEIRPFKRLRIIDYWMTDRLHDASSSLLTELLASAGTNLNYNLYLPDHLITNYSQEEIDALYDLTSYLTVKGGYRYVWGDSEVRAPALTGLALQPGSLSRNVGLAGFTYRIKSKLRLLGDFEGSSSNQAYFTTSLRNYEKARVRASYDLTSSLRLALDFSLLNNHDPEPAVRNDFETRAVSASAFWTPKAGKRFNVLVDYTRATVRSDILYLIPQTLVSTFSYYRDYSHTGTALATYRWFTLGGSFFISSGSRPTQYYQPLARFSLPLSKHVQWNAEWRWYGFAERFYGLENFNSNQFMTSLRLSR